MLSWEEKWVQESEIKLVIRDLTTIVRITGQELNYAGSTVI